MAHMEPQNLNIDNKWDDMKANEIRNSVSVPIYMIVDQTSFFSETGQ